MNRFVTGLVAGVAIGLLFAPEKGSETRKKLFRRGSDMKDQLSDYADDFSEELSGRYESAKDDVTNMARKGKKKAKEAVNGAEDAWSNPLS
jgi:gas vesicle protein